MVSGEHATETFDISTFNQYPHTLKYRYRNQVSLQLTEVERKCRLSQDSRTIEGLNRQGKNVKAVVYLSLPAEEIARGTAVEVYDGTVLMATDTVKNFRKGLLNARIWL